MRSRNCCIRPFTGFSGFLYALELVVRSGVGANIPLHNVYQERACGTLNRLYDDLVLGCHGRIGELQRVEVEDTVQDLVCGIWSAMNQHAQTIQRSSHEEAVTSAC